jgi:hypothetical protein
MSFARVCGLRREGLLGRPGPTLDPVKKNVVSMPDEVYEKKESDLLPDLRASGDELRRDERFQDSIAQVRRRERA